MQSTHSRSEHLKHWKRHLLSAPYKHTVVSLMPRVADTWAAVGPASKAEQTPRGTPDGTRSAGTVWLMQGSLGPSNAWGSGGS